MGFLTAIPAAVGGGIINALGVGGGAALEARAQNRATDAQERATQQALAFQREQAERGENAFQQQWAYWQATRDALAQHLGIDITPPGMGGAGAGGGVQVAGGAPPGAPPGGMPGRAPGGAPGPRGGAGPLQGRTLGELAEGGSGRGAWNDWGTMGLRGGRGRARA